MGWAAIGGALMGVGALASISFGLWGAGSHLWADVYFLAGFAAALLLGLLGFYVLIAEFIGNVGPVTLWLPPTRHEREAKQHSSPLRVLAPKGRIPLQSATPMHVDEVEAKAIALTLRDRAARAQAPPIVPEAHRDELKALAAAYSKTIRYRRPARGKQHARLEQSFWTHFPDAGKLLEKWDVAVEKYEASAAAFRDWLNAQDQALFVANNAVIRAVESGTSIFWKIDSGYLWLDGGIGIAPITDDTDAEALKQPYETLLTRARATPEAATLRATLAKLRAVEQDACAELERIAMLKVIRGKCDLC